MQKLTKEKKITEIAYVSNDGISFSYPSEAKEHEIGMLSQKLKKNSPRNLQIGNTGFVGMFYRAENREDVKTICDYFSLKAVDVSNIRNVTDFPEWIGAVMNNYNDKFRIAYSLTQLKEKETEIMDRLSEKLR